MSHQYARTLYLVLIWSGMCASTMTTPLPQHTQTHYSTVERIKISRASIYILAPGRKFYELRDASLTAVQLAGLSTIGVFLAAYVRSTRSWGRSLALALPTGSAVGGSCFMLKQRLIERKYTDLYAALDDVDDLDQYLPCMRNRVAASQTILDALTKIQNNRYVDTIDVGCLKQACKACEHDIQKKVE